MTTQATPNTPSIQDYLDQVDQLGLEAAKGGDSQIKLDLLMLEGAYHAKFDLRPDKHGTGIDDADMMTRRYFKGVTANSVFARERKSHSKTASNVRKVIKFGTSPQWGTNEPLANTNTFVATWRAKRKAGEKNLDDVHNALMRYITAQMKDTRLITGDQLEKFAYKPGKEQNTAADVLRAQIKTLTKLTVGKAPSCSEVDTSPEVQAAIRSLNQRLTNIAKGGV